MGKTMKQLIIFLFSLSIVLALPASSEDEPSSLAKDMPSAEGTFDFKPKDWAPGEVTWWEDSDGVDPGTAGCHIGTDSEGNPNGRTFGEACLDDVLLAETNPGEDKLHSHDNDIGHPDEIDCNEWCVGNGAAKGMCVVAAAPPCAESAMCVCE
jgi:hypothetical protein